MRSGGKKQISGGSKLLAIVFFAITLLGMIMIWKPDAKAGSPLPFSTGISQTDSTVTALQPQPSFSLTKYIWKVVFITAIIIGAFWLLARFYRQKMMPGTASDTRFTVLGREYLSPGSSLVMVMVENRKLLLGVTDSAVNLIGEFEPDTENPGLPDNSDPKKGAFQSILTNLKGKTSETGGQR
ncbi:MAG: flagellar biosynthetic protein FliO [FCB group bacterium]|nr:flagellar biosynthetic protein FliO [FCB group bacterium]